MSLLQRFEQFIFQHNLFSPKDKLLLAVSGGIDSVVLCELCKQAGYDFVIAHCNFKLRGKESERDKEFVQQLALKYSVPFLLKEFNTEQYAKENKLSIQEAARKLRYEWFGEEVGSRKSEVGSRKSEVRSRKSEVRRKKLEVRSQKEEGRRKKEVRNTNAGTRNPQSGTHHSQPATNIHHLLTAHHLNDNIETMLMHFFRGTGIHGLRGMLPKQGYIVRPLLFVRKEALKEFALAYNLQWMEDSSNALDKYSRNYIRHQVIPLMQKIYPEAESNLAHNLGRFADMEQLYEQAIAQHKKKLLEVKGEEVHIPVLKLKKSVPLQTIVYEIIKDFGFSSLQTGEVINLLDSESGKYVKSATHRILKNRNWLVIAPAQTNQSQTILIEAEGNWQFEMGNLQVAILPTANCELPTVSSTACFNASLIKFPLILRKWKQGDYFYPLGMSKKKKLARFFIDQKLSMVDKEKVWVLEMNKKIIWVAGMRIDDRFKVTPSAATVLRITLN